MSMHRRLLFCALVSVLFGAFRLSAAQVALPLEAPNLTGVYDDAGTAASIPEGQPTPDVISLHALLSLEFNPGMARLLQERTREIRITHDEKALSVEFLDRDGEKIWNPVWTRESGYSVRDRRVQLRIKPGKFGNDEYIIVLENVTTHRLLQVHIQKLKPTFFGPVFQPMGTFLFPRLD
ncbi:MAG: hypothetical protein QG602_1362 [Verrucomicrobiota bacterium]|nr:hypothetical protein [Verrucomicrobiota bacterium]